MKFVKTFFILISLSVLNAVFCFNYTFCSALIHKTENHPKAKNNLRSENNPRAENNSGTSENNSGTSENNSGTAKNTEKLTKNYLETSLKRYGIYQYKKNKILCEPYRVSKNDWLYKIFRKKGEISEKNFSLFINIFKTVNPKINDIDAILPGQIILIPLKKIHYNDFRETSPGVVDVPMIEFASIPESIKLFIKKHRVKKGETISQLLNSVFLNKNGTINAKGMRALKLSNPDIKDVNLIYAGSIINIPLASLCSQPWFQAPSHILNKTDKKDNPYQKDKKKLIKPGQKKTIKKNKQGNINHKYTLSKVLRNYASVAGGKLIHSGRFYFPRKNKPDIVLDLQSHPVIELANGGKILIIPDRKNSDVLYRTIGKFWKNFKIITLAEAVDSLSMQEPAKSINQLKTVLPFGHEAALKKILSFTRFQYIPDSQIALSFNSISLNVKLGRIHLKDRPDILVNFGTIYGYALNIIRKKGLQIIFFPPKNRFITSLSKLFTNLGMSVAMNPVFVSGETNKEITINGLYTAGNMKKLHVKGLLITDHQSGEETMSFLNRKNIKILFYTEDKIK